MNRSIWRVMGLALLLPFGLKAGAPDWLLRASRLPMPACAADAPAVVMYDDTTVLVHYDGVATTTHRYAVRILNRSGRAYARGAVYYVDKYDSISSSGAWIVRAGRDVQPSKDINWVDRACDGAGQMYTEERARVIDYSGYALEGDVFGYETTMEGKLIFPQLEHEWRNELPAVKESYTVRLPEGWGLGAALAGPASSSVEAAKTDREQVWTLRDRTYFPEEPNESGDARVAARLMVAFAPGKALPRGMLSRCKTWQDISAWLCPMVDASCDASPELAAAARRLTAGCTEESDSIAALGGYVQGLRYVEISRGLGKGFGLRPRQASEVFRTGWGDCKDKANLLRAMLREVGIKSYLVSANPIEGRNIPEGWPSVYPFNHAIVAIVVGPSERSPAALEVPGLGRLLFFDPTDPDVMPGDLPLGLRGTKVFVVAPESPGLMTLPLLAPETCDLGDRQASVTLAPDGSVSGEIEENAFGSAGARERAGHRLLSADEYRKALIARLNASVAGAVISSLEATDQRERGRFSTKMKFTASEFTQVMPGRLMLVRLDVLGLNSIPTFPEKERRLPVALKPVFLRDVVRVKLPSGYVVDELPDPVALRSPFGRCDISYAAGDGAVVARRTLEIEDSIVPVSEYPALRAFLARVIETSHASAVLREGP